MILSSRKERRVLAQAISEICILLFVVVVALVGIQLYVKRGLQARYKTSVDAAVTMALVAANAGVYRQYEPYYRDDASLSGSKHMVSEAFDDTGDGHSSNARAQFRQDTATSSRTEAEFGNDNIWIWEE